MKKEAKIRADKVKKEAQKVLKIEAQAIKNLNNSVNDQFVAVIEKILNCSGRVIMTGMGKSGVIAKKLAATLASTGTPGFFLHPAEAIHGDLGMVTDEDIVIALSNSGESEEIVDILPYIKLIGAKIVAMTGNQESTLANNADYTLDIAVDQEACPLDLAPTASTTAALAFGDALAIALLETRDFQPEDFALYHPGGSLGKKLLLTVEEILDVRNQSPVVKQEDSLKQALFEMTATKMGAVNIVNNDGEITGIITDGDIRRKLENCNADLKSMAAHTIMTKDPTAITGEKLAAEAVKIMEDKEINDLPVVTADSKPLGMINFQDLLRAGVI